MSTASNFITPLRGSWLDAPSHHHWLENEGQRLLAFYRNARHEQGGFAPLDVNGELAEDARPDTVITARITHCFALATMRGEPGAALLAAHGIAALSGELRDHRYGGWYVELPGPDSDDAKQAYVHVFVALAASSAVQAGIEGAKALLDQALEVIETRFWSDEEGRLRENHSRDWSEQEAYRGGNSNMHATELFLQLADVLDEDKWRHRALSIVTRLIHQHARANGYLLVEHFDSGWQEWRDYNRDKPTDDFRPYGVTPGHACEWSRLLLHLEAALLRHGEQAPGWLLEDAIGLFHAGLEHGWQVDGEPGLIYTHDWDTAPVVHQRLHWTVAEACAAASALLKRTGDRAFEDWYRRLWDYIDRYFIDRRQGSWWHELDRHNRPASEVWSGKPDLYHAYQLTLVPRLPLAPTIARAIAEGGAGS
ncbi:D-mannose isomerase [Halotalea alkalilenta]|uniref:Sugar isomerase n=1 Tax=Halotalea alkalilenta TaxID=376489 RepID=A0A172YI56_9GAMM|nr:AGE family epimerase/isomerase [Halotalea alkalilenta]ANF58877.1 sugar isomerase [Halotalea alkalilenta]